MVWFTDRIPSLYREQNYEGVEYKTIKYDFRKVEQDLKKGTLCGEVRSKSRVNKVGQREKKKHKMCSNMHSKKYVLKCCLELCKVYIDCKHLVASHGN